MKSIPNVFGTLTPIDRGNMAPSHFGMSLGVFRLPSDPISYATLSLFGIVSGSDVVILEAGTENRRLDVDSNTGTTYDWIYPYYLSGNNVDIFVAKAGYVPFYIRNYPLSRTGALVQIAQRIDLNYSNP